MNRQINAQFVESVPVREGDHRQKLPNRIGGQSFLTHISKKRGGQDLSRTADRLI
jgi:hypothetical protein